MSSLDAVLSALAHAEGRAQRRSSLRHRHLLTTPIAMVPWHLGAEPFTYAALAYGEWAPHFEAMALPGEPRDRRLLFPVTVPLAQWFNERFEAAWHTAGGMDRDKNEPLEDAPQIVVPNEGAVTVLRKLGRRFAYLPTEPTEGGPPPADPVLVRFGRHLQFLGLSAGQPGRQLVLAASTLAGDGWATEQTIAERANLAALDAWIDPPSGVHGFEAAAAVEDLNAGPLPSPKVEERVNVLVGRFDDARRDGNTVDEAAALSELEAVYRVLSEGAWQLMWRVVERERRWQEEARFLPARWARDVEDYARHMDWIAGPAEGRRRTRDTIRQAMVIRRRLEADAQCLEAEEALSDPLRLIPYLLDNKAIEGTVHSYELDHRMVKPGKRQMSRAPKIVLRTTLPCVMPIGKELWWSEEPGKVWAQLVDVSDDPSGSGSLVTLLFLANMTAADAIAASSNTVCFSELSTNVFLWDKVPAKDPWTHAPAATEPAALEED
ncbi:MAG: hypothetical protein M0Z46_21025 [Actinomycetota bacterium]|jgi:hypothetical protein|nr:hypothetical protein [Actinomycetota bacterium]